MFLLYFLLFIISLILIYQNHRTLFVPPTIIAITWALFPGLACIGLLDLYELSIKTHIIILSAFFSFMLAYYSKIYKLFVGGRCGDDIGVKTTEKKEIELGYVNYKLLIVVNVIIIIWLGMHLKASITIIQTRGYHALRTVYQDNFSESTIVNIIYGWFAKPFVIASLAIVSYDILARRKKMQIILFICVAINILLDTFVFAARATLVKFIVYIFFAFFFCKRRRYSRRQKLLIIMIALAGFVIISYITGQRNVSGYSDFSVLDTVAMYYVAPFGLLNYYINNPLFSDLGINNFMFGKSMFGFIYNIFRSALYVLFRAEYNGSDYINQQVTQKFVYVAPHVRVNAECTAAYIFMRDFGFFGVLIGFAGVAVFCRTIKQRFDNYPSIRNGALYIISLYVVFRLVSTYDFLSPATFFSILYVLVCTKDFALGWGNHNDKPQAV